MQFVFTLSVTGTGPQQGRLLRAPQPQGGPQEQVIYGQSGSDVEELGQGCHCDMGDLGNGRGAQTDGGPGDKAAFETSLLSLLSLICNHFNKL